MNSLELINDQNEPPIIDLTTPVKMAEEEEESKSPVKSLELTNDQNEPPTVDHTTSRGGSAD